MWVYLYQQQRKSEKFGGRRNKRVRGGLWWRSMANDRGEHGQRLKGNMDINNVIM